MSERCFYFGCWNATGHFLFAPGGRKPNLRGAVELYSAQDGERLHLDGTLAPRRMSRTGAIWWVGRAVDKWHRDVDGMNSYECPQGQFLRHVLPNGFTAIQWWDRNQGDKRGACNSTVLLEGEHTSEKMLAGLAQHFPHVLENLKRAGVTLVEVDPTQPPPTEETLMADMDFAELAWLRNSLKAARDELNRKARKIRARQAPTVSCASDIIARTYELAADGFSTVLAQHTEPGPCLECMQPPPSGKDGTK